MFSTFSGAPATNFSLASFASTDFKNPCVYFNSSVSLAISSSTLIAPEIGIKYSLDLILKDKAESTLSETYSNEVIFPSLVTTESK